jgi:glycosyltransferase involved in cell wall biosynthesis
VHLTLLTQYYPPEIGAPQLRLSELAAHFVQRGHSVTVLTAMPNYPAGKIYHGYGGLLQREFRQGVDVIRTFVYPTQKTEFMPRLTSYFSFVASSVTTGSILLPPMDYLLVESPPLFLGLAAVWLRRLKHARLIFNVADLWPESVVRLGVLRPGSLACRLSAWLETLCYRQAWLVTGQSRSILADITKRFPDHPTFHLSNGVDTQLFRPDRRNEAARHILQSGGDCVALYAGLHGIAQGLEQVLHAAKALSGEPGLQFVLVGDGPEKQMLVERARRLELPNVRFLASRPAREIPALLASADLALVITRLYIPGMVPAKLYEAMASGRPVILVARGEAAEIVREYQAGIVVEPGDIIGLTQAVQLLRARPDLRRVFGDNGRRAVEQHFDRTRIVTPFIEHLESNLCGQNPARDGAGNGRARAKKRAMFQFL